MENINATLFLESHTWQLMQGKVLNFVHCSRCPYAKQSYVFRS